MHEHVKQLCAQADEFAQQARFYEAVQIYEQAFELLPPIRERWEAATWIYMAIADAYFLAGDFESALPSLRAIMFCPGALDNAFVHLRRGQVFFELGEEYQAQQELAGAYMLAGKDIFATEDQKYAAFILPKLHPPAGASSEAEITSR